MKRPMEDKPLRRKKKAYNTTELTLNNVEINYFETIKLVNRKNNSINYKKCRLEKFTAS